MKFPRFMKARIFFAFFICLLSFQVFAQKGEPVIISVTYQFKHINDLNKPKKPYTQEMILRLGQNESRYNSWTDELNRKLPSKSVGSSTKSVGKGGGSYNFVPMVMVHSKGIQDFDLLQYPALNKLIRTVTLGSSNYQIETNLPIINWKVGEEKKDIGGYSCQKAVGVYAGRTYIAWFAPKLPFRCGPWKLSGLPGLILEATDLTGEVSFLFKELNKGENNESTAQRMVRITKVSEKAFERASAAFEKDPIAAAQGQFPIGTDKAQLAFTDDNGITYYGEDADKIYNTYKKELKNRRNNPLELKK